MLTRVSAGLEALSAVLIGVTMAAAYAGPLQFDVFGVDVSIRTLSRPLLAAVVVLVLRLWLLRGSLFFSLALTALAHILSGSLIAAGLIGWIIYQSPTCGGADSYGYVSAADRLLALDVVQVEPLAHVLPFPNAIRAACPLGYVPSGRINNASVPAYPLGLPAIMAVAVAIFGRVGAFFVAPLLGVVLLAASYATALAWYRDRQAALLACALLALHPVVFTYSIQPMSDVPAAAAMMLAIALRSRVSARPVLAGFGSALALIIRPALVLAAVALVFTPIADTDRHRFRSSLSYLIPVAAAVGFQAWTQWYLYGSVFASGYGRASDLFSIESSLINVRSYSYWGLLALGPVWFAGLAIGVALSGRLPRVILPLTFVGVAVPHLVYRPYDHWETLRFLSPVLVVATIVGAFGILQVARRVAGHAGGAVVAALLAMAMTYGWVSWLSLNNVFVMPAREARHRVVGDLVRRATPERSVVLALQHSGSLRYYAGRPTVNWDQIPPGVFAKSVRTLQEDGLAVFLVIDCAEERAIFEARHGAVVEEDGWLPGGQYRDVQLFEAKQVR